jgi:hypothetical protein
MPEKPLDTMTPAELRDGIAQYYRQQHPAPEVPLPPAAPRASMDAQTQERAFDHWVTYILSTPTHTWGPNEKHAVAVAATRALKEAGQ